MWRSSDSPPKKTHQVGCGERRFGANLVPFVFPERSLRVVEVVTTSASLRERYRQNFDKRRWRHAVDERGTAASLAAEAVEGECGKSPEVAAKFGAAQAWNTCNTNSPGGWRWGESGANQSRHSVSLFHGNLQGNVSNSGRS